MGPLAHAHTHTHTDTQAHTPTLRWTDRSAVPHAVSTLTASSAGSSADRPSPFDPDPCHRAHAHTCAQLTQSHVTGTETERGEDLWALANQGKTECTVGAQQIINSNEN